MGRDNEPGNLAAFMGKQLRGQRLRQKMTQAQLARRVGIGKDQISRWENGKSVIYSGELLQLCVALVTTPHEMLGWIEDEE